MECIEGFLSRIIGSVPHFDDIAAGDRWTVVSIKGFIRYQSGDRDKNIDVGEPLRSDQANSAYCPLSMRGRPSLPMVWRIFSRK
jgi:hypothetical protein